MGYGHAYSFVWLQSDEYTGMLERDFGYEINKERVVWLEDQPLKWVQTLIDAIDSLNPYDYTLVMKHTVQ